MSVPAAERPVGDGLPVRGRTPTDLLRTYRFPLIVAVITVLGAILIAVLSPVRRAGYLDPTATNPTGSKAIAVLLADRGSPVTRVAGTLEAVRALPASGTVVVTHLGPLPTPTLRALAALGPGQRIVLVLPDPTTVDALDAGVSVQESSLIATQSRQPGCGLPVAVTAGSAHLGGEQFTGGEQHCYDRSLVTGHTAAGAELVALGTSAPLTNAELGQDGDAALALGLLGQRGPVAWAVPGPSDTVGNGGNRSLLSVLPPWVLPVSLMLLVVALSVGLWQGRRFGRLVSEPLPVVVRAAEVVEGRGRLYRRGRARASAAEALRAAARRRITPSLGLGLTADASEDERSPRALCQAIAARTGRPVGDVQALLYGPAPVDEEALVRLASQLDQLVRSTTTDRTPTWEGHRP